MNFNRNGVDGWITIREISKETGDVLYEYTDKNAITDQGINTLFLRMALPNDVGSTMKLSRFKLGIDYGLEEEPNKTWSIFDPKPAQRYYTSMNQYVVYEVPESDMIFDHPEPNVFQASTLLDGKDILNTHFPDEVDLRYTSATFRFRNETTFSYKRFPIRSLSRLIDVQIIWTFKFVNEYDYVCPINTFESPLRMFTAEDGLFMYETDVSGKVQRHKVTNENNITALRVLADGGLVYTKSDKSIVFRDPDGFVIFEKTLTNTHPISHIDVDQFGFVYASLNNDKGEILKISPTGNIVWKVSIAEGHKKTINNIWVINNSRIAVSTVDPTSQNINTSGNMIHLIENGTGKIVYATRVPNNKDLTGTPYIFSSSGGETFILQDNGNDQHFVVKLAYDLSEISRIPIAGKLSTAYAMHDNFIVFAAKGIENKLYKYNSDLEFIWDVVLEDQNPVKVISVDRLDNIHVCTTSNYYRFTSDLESDGGHLSSSITKDGSAVGSKWTYFG